MSKLDVGVLVGLKAEPDPEIKKVADLGLKSCQICTWNIALCTDSTGEKLTAACATHDVGVSTFWAGYSGPAVWNFLEGPSTIGLVPEKYRDTRVGELKEAATWAAKHGLPSITTHVGFLPEDPNDPLYGGTVDALKDVVSHCDELGIEFWFETGQETPVTLLRTIERIGLDNMGINLDTANVILYGKGNPVDSLDVFGSYVKDLHLKDGFYPTTGDHLGKQVPLGKGKVDFKAVVSRLKELGYTGPLTLERECGDAADEIADLRECIAMLEPLR
ncbi:MAG: sugar phosphate isomerase/epimerase [Verrucomicrobia bacterium]|nr:sugar phosphate isomerase/epimerase [Verrucomicrobiota bacterium]MBT7068915.1 sugar phosphate isomerase/epimerase [Verrucomicrobiota bacterium]MBT7701772.1 sugar phosphate isomerase/epimerase [Verrucomicrobiota bacterium]